MKIESETITCRDYSKYDTTNVMSWKRSWNNLKQILLKVNNKHAQTNTTSKIITKNAKGRNSPWLTREIKSEMNNRDCLMRNVANRNLPVIMNSSNNNETKWTSSYVKLKTITTRINWKTLFMILNGFGTHWKFYFHW